MLVATADACYEVSGSLCHWVYERTDGNETLANIADWLVDKPLRILLILLVAAILTRITKRWIQRFVVRAVAPKPGPIQRLEQLGMSVPPPNPTLTARRAARAHSISVLLTSTIVVTIWTIAVMLVLGIVGVDLAPLLASAGVAGVALGFGAQTLVRDFISGLFMMLEDQYGIGDVVDLGEASGVVEDVSLRTTVLRGVDGTVWHVPNGVVQRVGNRSQLWSASVVDVAIAYDADLAAARAVLLEAANEVCERDRFADRVLEPPNLLGVEAVTADGVTLRIVTRVQPGTQFELQRAILEHIKVKFDEAGIELPHPQRTMWVRTEQTTPGAPEDASP